jgi:hypothetical protein
MANKPLRHAAAVFLALSAATLYAQTPTVFTTGLLNPAKIIAGPGGTFLVSEAGGGSNAGRISIVSSGGTRRSLLEALPSGAAAEGDEDGPTGILLDGDTLYIALGEGDQLVAGATQGTNQPNPKGPASPILTTILKVVLSQPVDAITAPFTLRAADHTMLADGLTVTLENGAGGSATLSVLAEFRYRPDPALIYRNSHPYALTKIPGDANSLYLADAGLNSVFQINLQTGKPRLLARFPRQPNRGTPGGPVTDAVPDSIRFFNGRLLVSLLTGFPFAAGNSKVMSVDPATGAFEPVLENLTSAIDVIPRARFLRPLQFLVLEHSASILGGAPGSLKLVSLNSTETVAGGLRGPTSMHYEPATGAVYITSRTDGTILRLVLGN